MPKTPTIAKLAALGGCVAALAFSGTAQASTEVINLGKITSASTVSNTFDFLKHENVIFKFKIAKGLTFSFFAMGNSTSVTETGGKGKYKYEIFDLKPKGSGIYDLTTSAVPEPAAWALLILGFGAVGGVARRRNRVAMQPAQAAV